jgi:uncharacterized protein (TIGR02147 family)
MEKSRIKELRKLLRPIPVSQFLHYRDWLKALYVSVKAQDADYSYTQFAEDLGFSKTNVLRLVVAGSRPLTAKAGEKIALALGLTGGTKKYWLTLVSYNGERLPVLRDKYFAMLMELKSQQQPHELDPLQAEYFSEWFHPVIREMTELKTFDGTPEWIRDRLEFPLRLDQVRKSLEVLAKLKVIRFDTEKGRFVRSLEKIRTDSEVDSLAVVRYHQKMIEMGKESITTVDETRRDVRAVTIAIPEKSIAILKGKIEEWIFEMAQLESGEHDADQVIQINVQMFPFTKK